MMEEFPSSTPSTASINSPVTEPAKKVLTVKFALGILGIIVALFCTTTFLVFNLLRNKYQTPSISTTVPTSDIVPSPSPTPQNPFTKGDYAVILKDTDTKDTKDAYLQEKSTKVEKYFSTVSQLYTGHYHLFEFHKGKLYVVHRTGGSDGYEKNADWTDWLSLHQPNGVETKLYSGRGLDFRVSEDGNYIAVITGEPQKLSILDAKGMELYSKTFTNDVYVDLSAITSTDVWIEFNAHPTPESISMINLTTHEEKNTSLENLGMGSEFDINTQSKKIAFSTYPALFDTESQDEFVKSKKTVDLYIYDMNTREKLKVASSTTERLEPLWKDSSTLEYTDPKSKKRVLYTIQ